MVTPQRVKYAETGKYPPYDHLIRPASRQGHTTGLLAPADAMEESCASGELSSSPLSLRSVWPGRSCRARKQPWRLCIRTVPTYKQRLSQHSPAFITTIERT